MWLWVIGCRSAGRDALVPEFVGGHSAFAHSATGVAHTGDPAAHSASGHSAAPHSAVGRHTADPTPDICLYPPPAVGALSLFAVLPFTEEFALDAAGAWYGVLEGPGLMTWTAPDEPAVLIPYSTGEAGGLRFLPDGDLVLADEAAGAVMRFDLTTRTAVPVLGGLPSPNTIATDSAGDIWVGTYGGLFRLRAGQTTPELVIDLPYNDLDGLTLSPDESRIWFNSDETGEVYAVDLDANRDILNVGVEFSLQLVNQLNGMTTDACGNLYVLDSSGQLVRRRVDGTIDPLLGAQFAYASAISFGSGAGGWNRDSLYVMDRASGVYELPIGIEGRPEPHL